VQFRLALEAWQARSPFPYAVVDDVCDEPDALMAILEEENVAPYEADLFRFEATAPEPRSDELRALRDQLGAQLAPVLARVSGLPVRRCDMRAFAYRPGHFLLPHTDRQGERLIAYAYYLPTPEPPSGGELELFPGVVIEPRPNRIALFEVSDHSLHQVREVLSGLRLSLAGWFYP
jgi:Rps23 Pro-64 3,4-dihydroxylase Tpa1-like proline 4-hydroxylase